VSINGPVHLTRLRLNNVAGCSFLITFFVEFEILFERGKLNRTPSIISKMQLVYIDE
jgi:hypothetical protein